MTNLEMTRLCAEAMGYEFAEGLARKTWKDSEWDCGASFHYDPLHNDAQVMALVKKFAIRLNLDDSYWLAEAGKIGDMIAGAADTDLNRAIVECCARMQQAKNGR